jgi:cytochrome P450
MAVARSHFRLFIILGPKIHPAPTFLPRPCKCKKNRFAFYIADIDQFLQPTPPHSLLYGNLSQLKEAMQKFPQDIHPLAYFTSIAQTYDFRGLFYLDTYPFMEPMVVITDPDVAKQIQTSPKMFTRHPEVLQMLKRVIGAKGIFFAFGDNWSRTRSWFKPAFSMSHLLTLVPAGMLEETLVFKEILTELAASQQTFRMFDLLQRLTFDLIGRTVANVRTKSQTEYSAVQVSYSNAICSIPDTDASYWIRFTNGIKFYWYTRNLDKHLLKIIKEKYQQDSESERDMSFLDLAWRGYSRDSGRLKEGKLARADLDSEFMEIALDK